MKNLISAAVLNQVNMVSDKMLIVHGEGLSSCFPGEISTAREEVIRLNYYTSVADYIKKQEGWD